MASFQTKSFKDIYSASPKPVKLKCDESPDFNLKTYSFNWSPNRKGKALKTSSRKYIGKEKSPKVKNFTKNTLSKLQQSKELQEKLSTEHQGDKEREKKTIADANEHIKKRNKNLYKSGKNSPVLHQTPWGVDQKQYDRSVQITKNQEYCELRKKVKSERERALKQGRARIGMEFYKNVKAKVHTLDAHEKIKNIKESDPEILKYMQIKQKELTLKQTAMQMEEFIRENERGNALYNLDLIQKQNGFRMKKHKTKKNSETKKNRVSSHDLLRTNLLDSPRYAINSQRAFIKNRLENLKIALGSPKTPIKMNVNSDLIENYREILDEKRKYLDKLIEKNEEPLIQYFEENPSLISVTQDIEKTSDLIREIASDPEELIEAPSLLFHPLYTLPVEQPEDTSTPEVSEIENYSSEVLQSSRLSDFLEPKNPLSTPQTIQAPNFVCEFPTFYRHPGTQNNHFSDAFIDRQITDYLTLLPFNEKEPEVHSKLEFIENCFDLLKSHSLENCRSIIDRVLTSSYNNPLEYLRFIQECPLGGMIRVPTIVSILMPDSLSFLLQQMNLDNIASREFYIKMLFDCTDEALNYAKPYGISCEPEIWSVCPRQNIVSISLENLFEKSRIYLKQWASMKIGHLHSQNSGFSNLRDERISKLLVSDVLQQEKHWVNYENEVLQTVMDLSDILLAHLLNELLSFLNNK